jgi:hypothetical protein
MTAAQVARFFHIDPMVVLRSGWREYAIRVAAWQYASELEHAQYEKRTAEARAKSGNK